MTVKELIAKLESLPDAYKDLEVRRYIEETDEEGEFHNAIYDVEYTTWNHDIGVKPHIIIL